MIAKVRLDRYYLADGCPFFRCFKNQAAAFHYFIPHFLRYAHDPIEGHAKAVENDTALVRQFIVNIFKSLGCFFP